MKQLKLGSALNENLTPQKDEKDPSLLPNHNVQLAQPHGRPHQFFQQLQQCDPLALE
jgi:hypothetical protein